MKTDIYQRVTDKIIADLEKGELTWLRPWNAGNRPSHSPEVGKTPITAQKFGLAPFC